MCKLISPHNAFIPRPHRHTYSSSYTCMVVHTLMSLHRLVVVWDGRNPKTLGYVGSDTSTKDVPSSQPTMAYSQPVSISVHPHMSAPSPLLPRSFSGTKDRRSTLLHLYSSALPFVQDTLESGWAVVGQRWASTHLSCSSSLRFMTTFIFEFKSVYGWKHI